MASLVSDNITNGTGVEGDYCVCGGASVYNYELYGKLETKYHYYYFIIELLYFDIYYYFRIQNIYLFVSTTKYLLIIIF
jgi:hypothetical protein